MGKTKCVSRHEKTDDLRVSEAAVDEERRTPSCVGRWKNTVQFFNPVQPHEETSTRREGRRPTKPAPLWSRNIGDKNMLCVASLQCDLILSGFLH